MRENFQENIPNKQQISHNKHLRMSCSHSLFGRSFLAAVKSLGYSIKASEFSQIFSSSKNQLFPTYPWSLPMAQEEKYTANSNSTFCCVFSRFMQFFAVNFIFFFNNLSHFVCSFFLGTTSRSESQDATKLLLLTEALTEMLDNEINICLTGNYR